MILAKSGPGIRLNKHKESEGPTIFLLGPSGANFG
jgi:hypothetical protein